MLTGIYWNKKKMNHNQIKELIFLSVILLFFGMAPFQAYSESSFRFIAIGDTPYSDKEKTLFEGTVTQAVKKANPPFVVHYGDFNSGDGPCTDAVLKEFRDTIYNLYPGRVFYTPGDNEWTDCDRSGYADPSKERFSELERLDFLKRLFFQQNNGKKQIKFPDPPDEWEYRQQPNFPENARWIYNGVLFVTLHMVSTNNGRIEILLDDTEQALALVDARDHANRVWLENAFKRAKDKQNFLDAVVIITQADVTSPDGAGPCISTNRMSCDAFLPFRESLILQAGKFRERGKRLKPVLLLHGDTNPYCWDKDFGGKEAPNLWRLNAWGDYREPADATIINVTKSANEPFEAKTLIGDIIPNESCN